jgi:hypothetical protein
VPAPSGGRNIVFRRAADRDSAHQQHRSPIDLRLTLLFSRPTPQPTWAKRIPPADPAVRATNHARRARESDRRAFRRSETTVTVRVKSFAKINPRFACWGGARTVI